MSVKRNYRLTGEMRKLISEIVRRDVKDPRISDMMSIVDVKVTEDLKICKVYVSIYGEGEPTIEALNKAKGFIRRELSRKMKIRTVPELFFEKDNSIEHGIYMSKLIDKVVSQEAKEDDGDNIDEE